jgi:hypothetical protein
MFEEVLWEMGHHYVPQRYLENFQDPNHPGFIWLHDKRAGVARLASIEKVAQVKGYYSEDTERYLAHEVETPANAVMKKLIDKTPITPAERAHMAYYIGVMLKRIPARHRHATEMIPSVLDDVVARIRRQLQETADAIRADPQVLARRLGEVDVAAKKFAKEPPPEVVSQIREPWPTVEMLQALFGMTWRILISEGPQYFVTSDNPAFFFRGWGIGREESELTFPLSTTHALHGSRSRAGQNLVFFKATEPMVKEFNRRLASETERLAFYHMRAPWLLKILPRKSQPLNAIRWRNS